MSTISVLDNENVLPYYFPRAPKECGAAANTFFACFSDKSQKRSSEDSESGITGLKACLTEKLIYERCMTEIEKRKPQKRYRVFVYFNLLKLPHAYLVIKVQAEYRLNQNS